MNLKNIMEDISKNNNIEVMVITDNNGFLLESTGKDLEYFEELSIFGKSLTSNLKNLMNSISSDEKTIQGLIEFNNYFILLTMFPGDTFLITLANKKIPPQNLWNLIAKRYKELAYELLE